MLWGLPLTDPFSLVLVLLHLCSICFAWVLGQPWALGLYLSGGELLKPLPVRHTVQERVPLLSHRHLRPYTTPLGCSPSRTSSATVSLVTWSQSRDQAPSLPHPPHPPIPESPLLPATPRF